MTQKKGKQIRNMLQLVKNPHEPDPRGTLKRVNTTIRMYLYLQEWISLISLLTLTNIALLAIGEKIFRTGTDITVCMHKWNNNASTLV
jgi:hypothetical protein